MERREKNSWQRPCDRHDASTTANTDGFVVNFVLRQPGSTSFHGHGLVLLVSGVECASWAHGLRDAKNGVGCGVAHPFFGTSRVVQAMQKAAPDWASKGEVSLRGSVRDQDGSIIGFVRA